MNCWIHFSVHWIWWKTGKKSKKEDEKVPNKKEEKKRKNERVNISILRIWVDNVYMYNAKGNYQSNVCNFSQNNQIIKSLLQTFFFIHLLYPLVAHTFFLCTAKLKVESFKKDEKMMKKKSQRNEWESHVKIKTMERVKWWWKRKFILPMKLTEKKRLIRIISIQIFCF